MPRAVLRSLARHPATILLGLIGSLGATEGGGQRPSWVEPPQPPHQRPAEWIPSPGSWEPLESAVVDNPQGETWRVASERRLLGGLRNRAVDVPVYLPRIVFQRIHGGDTAAVGILLPTDNGSAQIFPADGPEVSAVPLEGTEDAWGRWPNPCAFTIIDASGHLDLDSDGRIEVAVGRTCSCPSVACSGTLFVTLGPDGPAALDPADLVRYIRLGRIGVREMIAAADSSRPVLRVEPELLYNCRFIALAGIRGRTDCPSCCVFPVMLRPTFRGSYEPFYDSRVQKAWKDASNEHITFVASGDLSSPPTSEEEARLAQAAAFFYLAGTGARSHAAINASLGNRARDFHLQEILNRLDRIFLPDSTDTRMTPEPLPNPGPQKKPAPTPERMKTPGDSGPKRQGNG